MASASPSILDTVPPAQRVVAINEKVTGLPAAELMRRSGISESSLSGVTVLDNACGGGVLTALLLEEGKEDSIKRIVAGDIDDKMLSYVEQRKANNIAVGSEQWQKVVIRKIDQQAIPFADNMFTNVFSNMGVFFCPDDEKALSEAYRVLEDGGTAAFSSWKAFTWWEDVAEPALAKSIPEAPKLPSPRTLFPNRGWNDPNAIPAKLKSAGFKDLQVSEFSFVPNVEAEEFAEATGILVNVIAKRVWSEEEYASYSEQVEPALLRHLQENYANGKFDEEMHAIISIGKKV